MRLYNRLPTLELAFIIHEEETGHLSSGATSQFRLLLHGAAYWLLDTIQRWLTRLQVPHLQLGTLRPRLIKIGGWVCQRLDRLTLHLASSHPGETLWHLLATGKTVHD